MCRRLRGVLRGDPTFWKTAYERFNMDIVNAPSEEKRSLVSKRFREEYIWYRSARCKHCIGEVSHPYRMFVVYNIDGIQLCYHHCSNM